MGVTGTGAFHKNNIYQGNEQIISQRGANNSGIHSARNEQYVIGSGQNTSGPKKDSDLVYTKGGTGVGDNSASFMARNTTNSNKISKIYN